MSAPTTAHPCAQQPDPGDENLLRIYEGLTGDDLGGYAVVGLGDVGTVSRRALVGIYGAVVADVLGGGVPSAEQTWAVALAVAGRSMFLTGKAGTGKSTVTRLILGVAKALGAGVMVTGSTGVAAQQLGGQTLHRGMGMGVDEDPDRQSKLGENQELAEALRGVGLLVIDEISMVRADTLDVVDQRMRAAHRATDVPFGGVQVLLVGDGLQLPPVLTAPDRCKDKDESDKWYADFRGRWGDGLFRRAECWSEALAAGMVEYGLIQVRRQSESSDDGFVRALNQLRYGAVDQEGLDLLNSRVEEGFTPAAAAQEGYVVLTGRRDSAARINREALAQLPGELEHCPPRYEGGAGPADLLGRDLDPQLALKVGARVMTMNNSASLSYVNGSMGVVTRIGTDVIELVLDGSGKTVTIGRQEVKTSGSQLVDDGVNQPYLDESKEGTASQFPLRLAWAMTVHRAQGKSLEKVYVHSPASLMTAGQAYVALSRVISLAGLVLSGPIKRENISADQYMVRLDRTGGDVRPPGERVTGRVAVVSFVGYEGAADELTDFDRVLGYWAMVYEGGAWVASFGSLISPSGSALVPWGWCRRLGQTEMLACAPTLGEAWGLLERQLEGAALIVDGLGFVEKASGGPGAGVAMDFGDPISAQDLGYKSYSRDAQGRCAELMDVLVAAQKVLSVRVPAGITPGRGDDRASLWPERGWSGLFLDPAKATARDLAAAGVAGWSGAGGPEERRLCVDRLVDRARGRTAWTHLVRYRVAELAAAAGVGDEELPGAEYRGSPEVWPGMRAFFSGPSRRNQDQVAGAGIEVLSNRNDDRMAADVDVLVVEDLSLRTSAAKTAREYGIPIVRSDDFLAAVARSGA